MILKNFLRFSGEFLGVCGSHGGPGYAAPQKPGHFVGRTWATSGSTCCAACLAGPDEENFGKHRRSCDFFF